MQLAGSGKYLGFLIQNVMILLSGLGILRTWSNKGRVIRIVRETNIVPGGENEREGPM